MTNTYATPIKELTAVADQSQASNASREGKSKYRPEIDGLRAFAVVAVIVNHFNKDLLPSGYLGVDIFFVISGYVITSSLSGRESKNFWDFILSFYERRIKRLVPALAVFIAVSSLLLCFFNPDPSYPLEIATYALFVLSNISLRNTATDYFAPSTALNPFTHTWSLGVEEQFYLLFPIIIWFSGFGRKSKNGGKYLYWTVGALSIASLVGFAYLYPINQPDAYFLMPPRFWELGSGCLVFIGLQKRGLVFKQLEKIPPLLIVALMVGVLFLPLALALPSTIAIVFLSGLLICSLREGTGAYKFFTLEKVVYIGLISYSLYLWHWGVLSISRWTIGIHWFLVPFQIILMILLAIYSYRFVEKPAKKYLYPFGRIYSISAGIGTLLSSALVPFYLSKQPINKLFVGITADLQESGVATLTTPYDVKGMHGKWAGEDCVLSDNKEVGAEMDLQNCTLGDFDSSKKRVLVIGNSFSSAFVKAFDEIVRDDGYSVTITSSWGASPVGSVPNSGPWSKANYYYWNSVLPNLFNKLRSGDVVFAVNDLAGYSPPNGSLKSQGDLIALEQGISILAHRLSLKGVRLVFLHGLPFAREAQCAPNTAIKQWYSPFANNKCLIPGRKVSLARRKYLNDVFIRLQSKKLISVVDPFDVFCPSSDCLYTELNGKVLYRDEFSHPSVEGVRLLAPKIRSNLRSEGKG